MEQTPLEFAFFDPQDQLNQDTLLWSNQMDETVELYGAPVYYLPVQKRQEDGIFGDFLNATIKKGVPMKLMLGYPAVEDNFNDQSDMMYSKFGLDQEQRGEWFVSLNMIWHTHGINPVPGDYIYYPLTNNLFEVTHMTFEYAFRVHLYTKKADIDHEDIAPDMNVDEIKQLEKINDKDVAQTSRKIQEYIKDTVTVDHHEPDGIYGNI